MGTGGIARFRSLAHPVGECYQWACKSRQTTPENPSAPNESPPVILVRILCVAYWLLLTFLLLVHDPLGLLGLSRLPGDSGGVCVHFAVFAVLAALIGASRLPLPTMWLAALPIGYAA